MFEEYEELVIEVEEAPPKKVRKLDQEEIVIGLEEPSPPKEVSRDTPSGPEQTPHQFDFDLDP